MQVDPLAADGGTRRLVVNVGIGSHPTGRSGDQGREKQGGQGDEEKHDDRAASSGHRNGRAVREEWSLVLNADAP